MQAVIAEPRPATRLGCAGHDGWIGGNACDAECCQQVINFIGEPAPMPRFAGNVPLEAGSEIEKEAAEIRLEGQARRQLHQDRAELLAKGSGLAEKAGERLRHLASRRVWVISFGIFTANRKSAGTVAAHRW